MCKFGDVIVVKDYIGDDGKRIKKHSFVVIDDTPGVIKGLNYNLVTNVMSSFHDEKQRIKKLRYKENLEICSEDIISLTKNSKNGYIKADQLYYFDKNKLDYYVFAKVDSQLLDELIKLVIQLSVEEKLKINIKNLDSVA